MIPCLIIAFLAMQLALPIKMSAMAMVLLVADAFGDVYSSFNAVMRAR